MTVRKTYNGLKEGKFIVVFTYLCSKTLFSVIYISIDISNSSIIYKSVDSYNISSARKMCNKSLILYGEMNIMFQTNKFIYHVWKVADFFLYPIYEQWQSIAAVASTI